MAVQLTAKTFDAVASAIGDMHKRLPLLLGLAEDTAPAMREEKRFKDFAKVFKRALTVLQGYDTHVDAHFHVQHTGVSMRSCQVDSWDCWLPHP